MQQHSDRRSDGFSLVELMVVVLILLVLAAIAAPNLADFVRQYRIQGGAREVVSEIQAARTTAIMKNVSAGVVFYADSPQTYRFVTEDGQTRTADGLGNSRQRLTVPQAIAAGRAQASAMRELPRGIQFGGALCGAAPTSAGMRFNHLGGMCQPGGALGARCPAMEASVGVNAVVYDAEGASICVEDPVRNLARRIRITPGGRVRIEVAP